MWTAIVSKLLGAFGTKVVEVYQQKKQLKHDVKIAELQGKIAWQNALTRRASESEGRDADWERLSIQNSGWKDELVIIVLTIPMVMVFIPGFDGYIAQGFEHLSNTPGWYRWLIVMIYAATYGIRVWRRKV